MFNFKTNSSFINKLFNLLLTKILERKMIQGDGYIKVLKKLHIKTNN